MADQEKSHTSERGRDARPQRDVKDKRYTVGRDIPDESKERHTEIAVEAGRKYSEHPQDQAHTGEGEEDEGRRRDARDAKDKRGAVGRDIPDESKERHTEIAVEAGRKYGGRHDDKP